MEIEPELLRQIVDHAVELPRQEVCGVVAVETSEESPTAPARAVAVHRAENIHASALKFEIAPKELYEIVSSIEDDGHEIGGIYHSHVRSAPYPSQTDINFAAGWPGLEWIIVGLAGAGNGDPEPEVRSYLIDGADIREVPI